MLGKKPIFLNSKFLILLLYHITQKSIQINGNAYKKMVSTNGFGSHIHIWVLYEFLNDALQCNLQQTTTLANVLFRINPHCRCLIEFFR